MAYPFEDNIKLVYFDLGGVLFDFYPSIESLAILADADVNQVFNFWAKHDERMCKGLMPVEDFWFKFCDEFEFAYEGKFNFNDFWVKGFIENSEANSLFKKISKDYQVGILSNIYPGVFEYLKHRSLIPVIDNMTVVLSCEHGFVKPENELYEIAELIGGYAPNEIALIDDNDSNLTVASERGWSVYKF
ncbi:hypothetical protein KC660_01530 [Candidatus Dojkabacteria bacterium]|uniref:HAD family phosphatase n=1 Tax=Candidatus Dojkabacteria bacterium TaxID=2099670 RepID=A0A955L372_9BACT|nr:hypothetical protein [Candidatus Dojkabacteria bacterium]